MDIENNPTLQTNLANKIQKISSLLEGHFELTLIGRGPGCECQFILGHEDLDLFELIEFLKNKIKH